MIIQIEDDTLHKIKMNLKKIEVGVLVKVILISLQKRGLVYTQIYFGPSEYMREKGPMH